MTDAHTRGQASNMGQSLEGAQRENAQSAADAGFAKVSLSFPHHVSRYPCFAHSLSLLSISLSRFFSLSLSRARGPQLKPKRQTSNRRGGVTDLERRLGRRGILLQTHTLAHTHSLTHSRSHSHILSLTHSLSLTHTHSLSRSLTHTHTHAVSLSHTLSLSLSLSLSHTHTHPRSQGRVVQLSAEHPPRFNAQVVCVCVRAKERESVCV